MTRSLRTCGVLLILLIVRKLEGKALQQDNKIDPQVQRVKRGYSKYGENDFGTSIHVSSGVLQYGTHEEQPTIDVSSSYDHSPWKPSGPPAGYDVWLEPSQSYQPSLPEDISAPPVSSVHPGSDHISNGIFSTNSQVLPEEMPHIGQGLHTQISSSSQGLHTQISSSSSIGSLGTGDGDIDIGHHESEHISGNVDFNNIADLKSKHYAKSYGK